MSGNTREFKGTIVGTRADDVGYSIGGKVLSATPISTVQLFDGGGLDGSFEVVLADSLADAGELFGRRVRVTIEVLDG